MLRFIIQRWTFDIPTVLVSADTPVELMEALKEFSLREPPQLLHWNEHFQQVGVFAILHGKKPFEELKDFKPYHFREWSEFNEHVLKLGEAYEIAFINKTTSSVVDPYTLQLLP